MEFKKDRERWSERARGRESVSEPGKRTQSGGTFRETPKREKEGETKTEALREMERDSRGGGQKTPRLTAERIRDKGKAQELERHSIS